MDNSFFSSTTAENVSVSTPNRKDAQKPSIRASPIPGQNTAMFRRSEFSDTGILSTHSIASTFRGEFSTRSSRPSSNNCLETAKIRNFGYVAIQSTRTLSILVRNRFEQVVMLGMKLNGSDSDVFKLVDNDDDNLCVESGREILINVSFTPTKRTSYSRSLILTAIPDRRSGHAVKRYAVCLVGHGGTAILRLSQHKHELSPASSQSRLAVRFNGHYDARMQTNRRASFVLKNNGDRVAFVYVRALDQNNEDIPQNRLSISPNQFLLNKLCFDPKYVNIHVACDRLWHSLVHSGEEIRLCIYSVIERQRLRLIEYGKIRRQRVELIEDIDFTAFSFPTEDRISFDPSTISYEDVRVFKEELRVNFIRLLPPNFLTQVDELQELADNKYALLPVQFENDVVKEFDDDEETTVGPLLKTLHKRLAYTVLTLIHLIMDKPQHPTLEKFLEILKDCQPVIPDPVALHVMRKNGLDTQDPRIVRLISLATQKFISDITLDAMQLARMKGLGQIRKSTNETRFVLTTDLLESVLKEYGIPFENHDQSH